MAWARFVGAGLAATVLIAVATSAAAQSRAAMLREMGPHALNISSAGNVIAGGNARAKGAVCAYCHTPAGDPASAPAPAWQRSATPRSFQAYDSRGEDDRVSVRTSVSMACLSCHDGTQATNVSPQMPGRGRDLHGRPAPVSVGSNDHPVGMPFADFSGKTLRDATEGVPRLRSARIGTETRWWIDSEAVPNGTRDKSDIILYTRDNQGVATPYVECASCHDPHANAENMYLRTSNRRSMLCRACHGA